MTARRLVDLTGEVEAFLAGVLLGVASVSIWLQLASRALRGRAFSWPEELSVILLIYLSFLGAGALYKKQAHLRIDYFVRNFVPEEKQDIVSIIIWILSLVAFVVLLIGALQGMEHAMRYTSGAAIPLKRGYLRIPLIFMCFTNLFASVVFLVCPTNKKQLDS